MRKLLLRRVIPAMLLGVAPLGESYGMDPIDPPRARHQSNPIFLGSDNYSLLAFEAPGAFEQFSSERLTYRFPDLQAGVNLMNLALSPNISKMLFGDDVSSNQMVSLMNGYLGCSSQLRENFKGTKSYSIPKDLLWGVTLKENNELVGMVFAQFVSPHEASQIAPEGNLHKFYKDDIQKNAYVNIAYAVDPTHQRKGYATEMSVALMEVLFSHTNAEVILQKSIDSNIGSNKSAEICCFIHKGVSQGENFRILRKSSQLRLLEGSENLQGLGQPATEQGRLLEKTVFNLILENKIYVNLMDTSNLNNRPGHAYCIGRIVQKLPKDIEEMRSWCANGYQLGEDEKPRSEILTNPRYRLSTEHYSFRLFCYGIHNGCLPLVQYVLTNHNNIWDRKDLREELSFSMENTSFTLITYLIKRDYLDMFDYLIRNREFQDYSFGVGIKNGVGNTPFHTLAKYGSQAMIERFLKEHDLVNLCMNSDNLRGENKMDPLQLAESLGRPEPILSLFRGLKVTSESEVIDVDPFPGS